MGLNTDQYGCNFWWKDEEGNDCSTQWSPFNDDTSYFQPSKKAFMMNFRVENLVELMAVLKEEGVTEGRLQRLELHQSGDAPASPGHFLLR